MTSQLTFWLWGVLLLAAQGRAATLLSPADASSGSMNRLIASYSDMDPFRWDSFFSLPRTVAAAKTDGWAEVPGAGGRGQTAGLVTTWCRSEDYRVCLLFDLAGVVAGIQVSVSASEFEMSFGSKLYPIREESQWRRGTLLGMPVFSATALFVDLRVLMAGGRVNWKDGDDVLEGALLLENGASYWPMPSAAEDAGTVAFTKQGCVCGAGRHFAYNMSPSMACEEHRPFFLLFDDATGRLQGFGVSLYGRASRNWFGRNWLEAPRSSLIKAMFPSAPQCFLDWTGAKGLVTLHVFLRDAPWKSACAA